MSMLFSVRRCFLIAIYFLLSTAMLIAQVKIKEKLEIKPSNSNHIQLNSADLAGFTLPAIDPSFNNIGLYGKMDELYDYYEDVFFIPDVGGTMGIALYQCNGSATGHTSSDILLVFGPDGKVKYDFPLSNLDSCFACETAPFYYDGCYGHKEFYGVYDDNNHLIPGLVSLFNPFVFDNEGYERALLLHGHADSTDFWGVPMRIVFPFKSWEPLRFRLLTYHYWNTEIPEGALISPNYHWSDNSGIYLNWTQTAESYLDHGVLVFRTRDMDTLSHYDFATTFPMVWKSVDSSAVGALPTINYDDPIVLPDSGMYRIYVRGVKPGANGTLSITSPEPQVLFQDIQTAINDTIVVGPFGEGTQLQVEFNGTKPRIMQMNYAQWYLGYENWTDYDFGDVQIGIEYVAQPPDHLELWSTSSTVYYGDTVDVDIVPVGVDSLFSPLGDDATHRFSIELIGETSRYGELIYDDEAGDYFDNIPSVGRRGVGVRFAANKEEPDSVVDLTFHLIATYTGQIISCSVGETPVKQTETISAIKQTSNRLNNSVLKYKNNKLTPGISSSNSTLTKSGTKKLQAISAINRPKKKRIGSLTIANKNQTINGKAITQRTNLLKLSDGIMQDGESSYVEVENDWFVGEKKFEILLGETKYYKARKNPDYPKNLIIEEVTVFDKDTGEPLDEGEEDVEFSVANGQISKVYWESKWPHWIDKTINDKTYKTAEMKDLKTGLARVIGRYWQEGSKENIYLWAQLKNDRSVAGYIPIVVKKPVKLGNIHNIVTDVFGHTDINLDEIIIKYAGEYGIPPQTIKGQMQKESSQFTPAWRYEPFQDIKLQKNKKSKNKYFGESMPFVVDETTMGSGDMPTSHFNEDPNPYFAASIKIGSFLSEHWGRYVQKHTGNTPDSIVASSILSQRWKELYAKIKKDKNKIINDGDTRTRAHDVLKMEIQDQNNTIGKSFDIIAQTRKVTSYGLSQMMYITAADNLFDKNHNRCSDPSTTRYVYQNDEHTYPEKLNEQEFLMPRYCDYLWTMLNYTFTGCIPEGNWQGGFEGKWEKALIKYNGAGDYGKSVLTNSQNFKLSNQ